LGGGNGKDARGKVVWRGVYYPLSNFGVVRDNSLSPTKGWGLFSRDDQSDYYTTSFVWGAMNYSHLSLLAVLNNEIPSISPTLPPQISKLRVPILLVPLIPRSSKPLSLLVARVTRSLGGHINFVATTPCCCQCARIG
jgi:hypothetical protein